LLDPYGQPIHLAADVFASVDQLRAPGATREAIFALQASHLTGKKTDRLAGSDTWHTRMESEALRWNSFKNNAATKPFADLLANHPTSKHWSEGELGIVSNMHKWFEHLANLHGIKSDDFSPAAVQAREKLLTEIFKRGFGPTGEQVVSSAGKLVDLNRAFREMVVEKVTGINLDQLSGPRDPARVAAALNRAGIGEHQFAHYSNAEREILLQHLYTLESRHAFYDTMKSLEHLGGGAHGAQQNITEVLGELALAAHMVINHQNLRLAIPFSKGTGFDQVWVGHNAAGEKIYVIGEAKGPGAELGAPGKGPQMSAEWVVNTLREMLTSSNSAERALAKEMLLAIIRARDESIKTGTPMPPIVSGVIIEAGNPANKADASTGASGYDFRAFDFTAHTNILAGK
jgi:hypothetical protein